MKSQIKMEAAMTHDQSHAHGIYSCPMHPEVRQTKPGSCPICGMGLERDATGAVDVGPNPELVDFTRRMWVGVALTLPLFILGMGPLVGLGWMEVVARS